MKFKNFEIRRPTFIGKPPSEDYFKYNYDVVKWNTTHSHCWSIASLHYDTKEGGFELKSVGLRYLKYREAGLEEFIILWCDAQCYIIEHEEEIDNLVKEMTEKEP